MCAHLEGWGTLGYALTNKAATPLATRLVQGPSKSVIPIGGELLGVTSTVPPQFRSISSWPTAGNICRTPGATAARMCGMPLRACESKRSSSPAPTAIASYAGLGSARRQPRWPRVPSSAKRAAE